MVIYNNKVWVVREYADEDGVFLHGLEHAVDNKNLRKVEPGQQVAIDHQWAGFILREEGDQLCCCILNDELNDLRYPLTFLFDLGRVVTLPLVSDTVIQRIMRDHENL